MRKHFAVVALSTLAGIAIGATAVQKLKSESPPACGVRTGEIVKFKAAAEVPKSAVVQLLIDP